MVPGRMPSEKKGSEQEQGDVVMAEIQPGRP